MMHFFRTGGPFMWPLALLALVVLALTMRQAVALLGRRPAEAEESGLTGEVHAILFWGAIAAVLGLLGQYSGLYIALNIIARAREISPQVVAQGVAESFTTTLTGLVIFLYAAIAWRLLLHFGSRRSRAGGALVALLALLLAGNAAAAQPSSPVGFWEIRLPGPGNHFVFEVSLDAAGEARGAAHSFDQDLKQYVTPMEARLAPDGGVRLTLAATGVSLEGRPSAEGDELIAEWVLPDGSRSPARLRRVDPLSRPGLRPRPAGTAPYAYAPPPALDDGWPSERAAAVGLDEGALAALVEEVLRGEAGELHGLLIARRGRLVLEEYFYGYDREKPHPFQSGTKSVASLLVGIAIDQGRIGGVDAPLLDFFPRQRARAAAGWEGVTLRHLLTMTAGAGWDEAHRRAFEEAADFASAILSVPVTGEPGARFEYASENVNLLAGVLEQATGQTAEAFARENLWQPLGIESADWSAGRRGREVRCDGSLRLRPRDMAKLGQLVLDRGVWGGRQVVSDAWIAEATREHASDGGMERYGYLWWLTPPSSPVPAVFANGIGSQFVLVIPALEMVIVTTGGNQENGQHLAPLELLAMRLPGMIAAAE